MFDELLCEDLWRSAAAERAQNILLHDSDAQRIDKVKKVWGTIHYMPYKKNAAGETGDLKPTQSEKQQTPWNWDVSESGAIFYFEQRRAIVLAIRLMNFIGAIEWTSRLQNADWYSMNQQNVYIGKARKQINMRIGSKRTRQSRRQMMIERQRKRLYIGATSVSKSKWNLSSK